MLFGYVNLMICPENVFFSSVMAQLSETDDIKKAMILELAVKGLG